MSIWTSLVGPCVAILLSLTHEWSFALGYLAWIMLVRLGASLLLGVYRRRFSPLWPILLYYNQIIGAVVKTYVASRLNQQKWDRQNIFAGESADPGQARRERRLSALIHTAKLAAFLLVLAFYAGALPVPTSHSFRLLAGDTALAVGDAYWITPALREVPAGGSLRLPSGRFMLPPEALTGARAGTIVGAGSGRTLLTVGAAPSTDGARAVVCGGVAASCLLDWRGGLRANNLSLLAGRGQAGENTIDGARR
jgi:glycosyltransferase Alg8